MLKNIKPIQFFPILIFTAILLLLWVGLGLNPRDLPSEAINKPLPKFTLFEVVNRDKVIRDNQLKGKIGILHFWATWCGVCAADHQHIVDITNKWDYPFYGVSYKDDSKLAQNWLNYQGNPYTLTVHDSGGSLGLDLGVYGTPEFFLLDADGKIRYRHVGALSLGAFEEILLPVIKKLEAEQIGETRVKA